MIKVKLNDNARSVENISYPILARLIGSSVVVLFSSSVRGVVIIPNELYLVGEILDFPVGGIEGSSWEILPAGVTVTLENK